MRVAIAVGVDLGHRENQACENEEAKDQLFEEVAVRNHTKTELHVRIILRVLLVLLVGRDLFILVLEDFAEATVLALILILLLLILVVTFPNSSAEGEEFAKAADFWKCDVEVGILNWMHLIDISLSSLHLKLLKPSILLRIDQCLIHIGEL